MLQSDVRKVSAYKAEMQEIIYSKDIMEDNEMTKVDIISGFLGAGKTTLIAKLLKEAFSGEQVVLIENEFGEIGIDGGFLKESGVEIREMNSGCICCSLVGDFGTSLKEVVEKYHPDRIIIEPSGVGKLSDVIKAVKDLHIENEIRLNSASTVADASKVKVYMKNFGEFFNNQIEHAGTIILSRTQNVSEAKLKTDIELIRSLNKDAHIITTPWDDINVSRFLMQWKMLLILSWRCLQKQQLRQQRNMNMSTTMTMMESVAADMTTITSMSIITIMTESVAADMTTITSMSITTTMTESAAADMIIIMDIIMLMRCLQAGV